MGKFLKSTLSIATILIFLTCQKIYGSEAVTFIADEINYSQEEEILTAKGNVKVKYGDYQLSTSKLIYNKKKNLLIASSPIQLNNKNVLKIIASSAEINDNFRELIASKASALIENTFYIKSEKMKRSKNRTSTFYNSIGTTCEVCPSSPIPMWQIKSEKILHDPKTQQLHFKNAWMELLGLPIFYTPYLRIPEPGVKRATGLLTPKILTSDLLGVGIKQPFYINLSQSSDITLSLLKTSKTRFLLETDYRKILNDGYLQIAGAAKPGSKNNILDGYFHVVGSASIYDNSNLTFDTTAVSDSGFLGKYGYSDTDRLTSTIAVTNQKHKSFYKMSATYFTSLRDNIETEYIVAPNLFKRSYNYSNYLDMFYAQEFSLIGLTKKNLDNNFRFNANINTEKDWVAQSGLRFLATSKLSANFYRIQDNDYQKQFFNYFDPTLGLELTYPLYRQSIGGLKTIKPTLQLLYNPGFNENNNIPNTDSQQIKLDQSSLFSLNRFSGLDRQETGLRLNSGVEYSVEDQGLFSYDIAFGQVFRRDYSTQFSEGSGLDGLKSDILISGNFDYSSLITIHAQQLYDQKFELKQAETTLSYLRPNNTITGGLIFFNADQSKNQPFDLTELTLGLDSTLNKNWQTSFDLRRNILANENINASIKISYENNCAKVGLSFKKRFTETDSLPADTSLELNFDLNGIGDKRNSLRKSNCLIYN